MKMIANAADLPDIQATPSQAALDYERIERALHFLHTNFLSHPSLEQAAAHIHMSDFHFERLFQRWAGTSPKRFLQFLTKEHARTMLRNSASVLQTAYASGLSSPGRLHDLFVTCEAVTPGACKTRGQGITIRYGIHPTPFGNCLLALTDKGICALQFVDSASPAREIGGLAAEWRGATLLEDREKTSEICQRLFVPQPDRTPFHLHIRGTNFQLKVWQALLSVPEGKLVSYSDIADAIHCPKSQRAVGTAIGKNPIGCLIPCHRVIHRLGTFGNYRWGVARKQALIGWEAAASNLSHSQDQEKKLNA